MFRLTAGHPAQVSCGTVLGGGLLRVDSPPFLAYPKVGGARLGRGFCEKIGGGPT